MPRSRASLLAELASSGCEFVLVGGLAAVAQGAPVTTFDVDIVHARTADNVDGLLAFLATMRAAAGARGPRRCHRPASWPRRLRAR